MKITIEINDKTVERIKKVLSPAGIMILLATVLFFAGLFVFSQEIISPVPHQFKSGDVISAKKMNENFDVLYKDISQLSNRSLDSLKDVHVSDAMDGKVLKYDNGGWVPKDDLSCEGGGDNLGNHTAIQNINLNKNWLSGTGTSSGLYIDGSGNVGIGTNMPGFPLDITGTVHADSFRLGGETITAWPEPGGSGDGHSLDAADGFPVNAVYVNNSGNVGIGTTAPGYRLDVTGTVQADSFRLGGESISSWPESGLDGHSLDAADGDPANVVYVNKTGDVGIGTTSPKGKLVVRCNKQGPICEEQRAALVGWNSGGDQSYENPIGVLGIVDSDYVSTGYAGFFIGKGYFTGAVGIGTHPSRKLFVQGDAGGTTAWYNDSHSSYKQNFEDVEVLEKVKTLSIKEWEYKPEHTTADNSRHVSPFSEEFHAAFGLGDNEKQIQALDVAGVALKAIQEQQKIIEKQQETIEELKREIEELKMRK